MQVFRRRFAFASTSLLLLGLVSCGDQKLGPDAGSGICSDGIDNDGDGLTDYPADFGCEDEADETEENTAPACADHRDNDGDGKADYPEDPGCIAPNADDETDDCPSGPHCPQCSDGKDNDFNGKSDWPEDSMGCASAGDNVEFTDNSVACGNGLNIDQLPVSGMATGMLMPGGSTTNLATSCGGVAAGAPAIAYVFHVSTPQVIVATTEDPATTADTVLDLRSSMCADGGAELACHDNISTTIKASTITRALAIGTYYLVISGKLTTDSGPFALKVQFFPGEGVACNVAGDCGPTLVCRVPKNGTSKICTKPVCSDGQDDDDDGKIDYPADPGCTAPTDSDEADVCATMPTDPSCPKCANGIDDDLDGDIDYPNDPTCVAASTNAESCLQSEPILVATTANTPGTTVGAVNDFMPPVGQFNGHACSVSGANPPTPPDVAVQLDIPAVDRIAFRVNNASGYDSVHVLLDASCGGTPLECYDDPNGMVMTNLSGGRYYLILDGWFQTSAGAFNLNIAGTIKNGASCESPLAQSGALVCNSGHACSGTAGSRTCALSECNDGIDNNGDGKMDYPADPGCLSIDDGSENTVCPGTGCPACADGIDNDGDMLIDYPADTGCFSAAQVNEGCRESEPLVAVSAPTMNGTLVGATDDHDPKCVTTNQPDRVFTLDIPVPLQSLRIDTVGSVVDTVLSLMTSTCGEPSLDCDNDGALNGDSVITRANVAPGLYTIAVDSNTATLDTFILNVKGVIRPGASCEGALFQAGVLTCPVDYGCNGPAGAKTCTPAQCKDGIDNNGDGLTDYPNDPSCTSYSDNTETTVCPGASCPVCFDGMDNDNDGKIDYPADPACASASGTSETCADPDLIGPILTPTTFGTLVGTADNHQPVCSPNAGADAVYSLTVPALDSLTLDTRGSVVDTVLSFMTNDCAEPAIACDDDTAANGDSLITRTAVPAGTYTIMIDSDTATPNTFRLGVDGVISPGGSCESPLFATGVLRCSLGFACDGPVGQRTCAVAECIDGLDNNGDGLFDYPFDPGCSSFSDDSEGAMCPGPNCPSCNDGIDNDGDGLTDYPMDPSCSSAGANNESCNQSEPIGVITQQFTSGMTTGNSNDYTPTCGGSSHNAPDVAYQLDVPAMQTLNLNLVTTNGWDGAHALLNSTCGGTAIACSDPALMTNSNVAAGTYFVVVDGYNSNSGSFTLETSGVVAPGGSCEGTLFQIGAFTCPTGFSCFGTPGTRTCKTGLVCNDNIDQDGDGKTDYPFDPGCTSPFDTDETDDCFPTVGPACPACGNGLDDDNDGATDYPADTTGCRNASYFSEDFCPMESDFAGFITTPATNGTLANGADDYDETCQSSTGNDVSYVLDLPVPVASLVVDTNGSTVADTVLSVWTGTCGTQLGCDDDAGTGNLSLLTLSNVAIGKYAIHVDGYSTSNNGVFKLNVKGTVAAGTACTSPLFTSGVLVCPAATTCTAGTCQ